MLSFSLLNIFFSRIYFYRLFILLICFNKIVKAFRNLMIITEMYIVKLHLKVTIIVL